MLDIKLIRQQPDVVRDALRVRGADVSLVDHILEVDKRRRELLQHIEALRAEQKRASAEIARRQGAEQESRIAAARDLSDRLRVQGAGPRAGGGGRGPAAARAAESATRQRAGGPGPLG